jgi:site-specific DNA recombinase
MDLDVRVSSSEAIAMFDTNTLLSMAALDGVDGTPVTLTIPTTQASYGHEPRLRLEPGGNHGPPRDERLVELIARGFAARDQLLEMDADGVAAIAGDASPASPAHRAHELSRPWR